MRDAWCSLLVMTLFKRNHPAQHADTLEIERPKIAEITLIETKEGLFALNGKGLYRYQPVGTEWMFVPVHFAPHSYVEQLAKSVKEADSEQLSYRFPYFKGRGFAQRDGLGGLRWCNYE